MFEDEQSDGILQSEEHLTAEFTPDEPVGRDTEIERIAAALRPLAHGRSPTNLLVYGPAGIGKSVCVTHVSDRLATETRVKTVYINCWQYNTRPSFLTQLLIALDYPAPRKGKPVDTLLATLREWVDKNQSLAIILDEFDKLSDQTEIIYDLNHVGHAAENNLGLLLVSNEHPSNIQLDPRSESRLSCRPLEFRPYTADELVDILEQRVDQAFRPESVESEVIEDIAEHVAEQSGDCRQALNLLLQAGRHAEQTGADAVTTDLLDAVR